MKTEVAALEDPGLEESEPWDGGPETQKAQQLRPYDEVEDGAFPDGPVVRGASQVVLVVKNSPASAGDAGLIPGSERSPGVGNGNPLQYSCLQNSMDRGAWWATGHGVTKNLTHT